MDHTENREILENVVIASEVPDGPQYIRLADNSQIISSELLQNHNGLVVDLGGNDFIPVTYRLLDRFSPLLGQFVTFWLFQF